MIKKRGLPSEGVFKRKEAEGEGERKRRSVKMGKKVREKERRTQEDEELRFCCSLGCTNNSILPCA